MSADHFGSIDANKVYLLAQLMELTGISTRATWNKMFKDGLRRAVVGGKIHISGRSYQLYVERKSEEGGSEWGDEDDE